MKRALEIQNEIVERKKTRRARAEFPADEHVQNNHVDHNNEEEDVQNNEEVRQGNLGLQGFQGSTSAGHDAAGETPPGHDAAGETPPGDGTPLLVRQGNLGLQVFQGSTSPGHDAAGETPPGAGTPLLGSTSLGRATLETEGAALSVLTPPRENAGRVALWFSQEQMMPYLTFSAMFGFLNSTGLSDHLGKEKIVPLAKAFWLAIRSVLWLFGFVISSLSCLSVILNIPARYLWVAIWFLAFAYGLYDWVMKTTTYTIECGSAKVNGVWFFLGLVLCVVLLLFGRFFRR